MSETTATRRLSTLGKAHILKDELAGAGVGYCGYLVPRYDREDIPWKNTDPYDRCRHCIRLAARNRPFGTGHDGRP